MATRRPARVVLEAAGGLYEMSASRAKAMLKRFAEYKQGDFCAARDGAHYLDETVNIIPILDITRDQAAEALKKLEART